jgi:pyruvate dehydrogenase E1 component
VPEPGAPSESGGAAHRPGRPPASTWSWASPRRTWSGCSASWARLGRPDGTSAYLRLSTRPVDQHLAAVPADPAARERRRRQVVAGAYLLRRADDLPAVTIAAMGATVPEALAAANRLADLGHAADVVCVTSPGLLFDAVQARGGRGPGKNGTGESWVLDSAFPTRRAAPLVTLLDGHPHALAFPRACTGCGRRTWV